MSDNPTPEQVFVEAYLDVIQANHPGAEGEAVRAALRSVHEQTKDAERTTMAIRIFTHIREICLSDLMDLRANGLRQDTIDELKADLVKGMDTCLTRIYSAIVQNIALAGGIKITNGGATAEPVDPPALPPPSIQVADELSDEDKKLFDSEVMFGCLTKVGQA